MPKVKVITELTPDEFRKILTPKLREAYDSLVNSLVENGIDERYAKLFVAKEMNQAIKDILKEMKNSEGD